MTASIEELLRKKHYCNMSGFEYPSMRLVIYRVLIYWSYEDIVKECT